MRHKTLCVYCGSSERSPPDILDAARCLGRRVAESGRELVYGGAGIGVMGALARAALEAGGRVTGVIPEFLSEREIPLKGLSQTITTGTMHERKHIMFERADAFIALPGGIGTLEELVEIITWAQLRRHRHPVIIVNIGDFWSHFFALLDHMVAHQFMTPEIHTLYHVTDGVDGVLPLLESLEDHGGDTPSRSNL